MYNDPRHARTHAVKLSLNEEEALFVEKAAEMARVQKSTYLRELALEKLREILAEEDQRDSA